MAEIRGITGMRGMAATYVLLLHAVSGDTSLPAWLLRIVGQGGSGVDFFFILSGYLLYSLYSRPDKRYFVRRVFRVFPLYYASLPLYAAVGAIAFSPLYLIYAENYFPQTVSYTPLWTLNLEEIFYFVLLPILLLTRVKPRHVVMAAAAVLICWTFLLHLSNPILPPSFLVIQLPEYLLCYAVGIWLAKNGTNIVERIGRQNLVSLVVIAMFAFVVALVPITIIQDATASVAIYTVVYGLMLLFMQQNLIFTNRITHFLGKISYGVYILQYPLLGWIPNSRLLHLGPEIGVPLAVALTIAISAASYYLYESPLIRLGRRMTGE